MARSLLGGPYPNLTTNFCTNLKNISISLVVERKTNTFMLTERKTFKQVLFELNAKFKHLNNKVVHQKANMTEDKGLYRKLVWARDFRTELKDVPILQWSSECYQVMFYSFLHNVQGLGDVFDLNANLFWKIREGIHCWLFHISMCASWNDLKVFLSTSSLIWPSNPTVGFRYCQSDLQLMFTKKDTQRTLMYFTSLLESILLNRPMLNFLI